MGKLKRFIAGTVAFLAVGIVCVWIAASSVADSRRLEARERLQRRLAALEGQGNDAVARLAAAQPGRAENVVDPLAPIRRLRERIAHSPYADGWAAYDKYLLSGVEEFGDADWEALRQFFAANSDLMAQVLYLADCPENICGPGFWDALNEQTKRFMSLKEPTWLITARAALAIHDGRKEDALEDLLVGLRLSNLYLRNDGLLYRQVHLSSLGAVLYQLSGTMPEGFLAPDQYRQFIRELGRIDVYDGMEAVFVKSLDENAAFFDRIRREGIKTWHSGGFLSKQYMRFYGSPWGRPLLDMDEARTIEFGERVAVLMKRPVYQTREQMAHLKEEFCGPGFGCVFTRLFSHPLTFTVNSRDDAQIELARIGLAIEIYRAEQGTYPPKLADVAHELGGSVPVDPFTGESYRYRVSDDGFLLYSVGMDFEDDGGTQDVREGDMVWRSW